MSWLEILLVTALLVAIAKLAIEVREMKRDIDKLIDNLPADRNEIGKRELDR